MNQKFVFLFVFLLSMTSHGQETSDYKGYVKINKRLMSEVFASSQGEVGLLINESFNTFFPGLLNLMGYHSQGIDKGVMTNGQPNSVSWMIHYILFQSVAERISYDCLIVEDPMVEQAYLPSFYDRLSSICSKTVSTPLTDQDFLNFWVHFHGYLAPQIEFEEWKDFHSQTAFTNRRKRVRSMLITAMLNPYFMVQ